jgi:hypothetical protein
MFLHQSQKTLLFITLRLLLQRQIFILPSPSTTLNVNHRPQQSSTQPELRPTMSPVTTPSNLAVAFITGFNSSIYSYLLFSLVCLLRFIRYLMTWRRSERRQGACLSSLARCLRIQSSSVKHTTSHTWP